MGGKKKRRKHGPKVDGGSREARRQAMLILEVLAGHRTPGEAAQVLGVSAARYYALEARGLEGLVAACEPRRRGPGISLEKKVARLEADVERLERECQRRQALLRLAQRAAGVPAKKAPKVESGKRKRRPTTRALKAAEHLKVVEPQLPAPEGGEA